jgi:hypothetical protein
MRRLICGLGLALAAWAGPGLTHEFWIAPERYALASGDTLRADLRVGEMLLGVPSPYFPDNFVRFDAGPADALAPVPGRMGDRPALALQADAPGLWLIVHQTTPRWLTYNAFARFEAFTGLHDLDWAQAAHRARDLPESGFREIYFRHAKALVAVGDATGGADRRLGLGHEIVAETNPYALTGGGRVVLRMYEGETPRAHAQMEVYLRSDGAVTRNVVRSDADGRVALDLPAGIEVMANFTTLTPLEGDPALSEEVWRSDWASLSFAMP